MARTVLWANLAVLVGLCGFATASEPTKPSGNGPPPAPQEDWLSAEIPMVEAATLHSQTLEDAPASVTVITASEIRRYGYRTFRDALASIRGFYFTNDRMYDYSGVRGLAIPGDYNSRYLVMLNGHPLTENIYNSNNFFGHDFGLDMDLVERIEVIRGPSSALFGSNGMLATINVVTKSPVDHAQARASLETGSFGETKAMLSTSLDLGKGANLFLSGSVFRVGGRSLQYPQFATGESNGLANRVDRQDGYHTFANLTWGKWSLVGYFNQREIGVPVGGGGTVFNSQGQYVSDGRNFVGLNYTQDAGFGVQLKWRMAYDQYRYRDRWDYPVEDGLIEDNRTLNWGDWISSQVTASKHVAKVGVLTVGVSGTYEVRARQINENVSPERTTFLDINTPDRSVALFAQQELAIAKGWTAYLGVRVDRSRYYGIYASPRLALVYQPSQRTSWKLVYGRPFRNPSAFERFYDDNGLSYVANPLLARETAQAMEASVERKITSNLTGVVNSYHYRLRNVIQNFLDADGLNSYANSGARRSTGVEVELRGNLMSRLEAGASLAIQRASERDHAVGVPNAPGRVGHLRLGTPLTAKLFFSSAVHYLSGRTTERGELVRPVLLVDASLSTRRLFRGYDLVGGIRNGLHYQYDHPASVWLDRVRANGRTYFVKLIWQIGD